VVALLPLGFIGGVGGGGVPLGADHLPDEDEDEERLLAVADHSHASRPAACWLDGQAE